TGRIFCILSFVVVFVVIGVPLWWKTTTTYRVSLPYGRIQELSTIDLILPINLEFVLYEANKDTDIYRELEIRFKESKFWVFRDEFKVSFRQATTDEKNKLKTTLKDFIHFLTKKELIPVGNMIIHILPNDSDVLPTNCKFYVTNHRFTLAKITPSENGTEDLRKTLLDVIINRNGLQKSLANVIAPNLTPPDKATMRTLLSSPSYDLTFSLIIPQPHLKILKWEIEKAINMYFQPMFDKLSKFVQFNVKSQVLYLTTLNVKPNYNSEEKYFYLSSEQLPHVINPIEAKLGSYVSVNQNINFVVYVPMQEESPLFIYDSHGLNSIF
uniref:Uncharacterized protein n=1 Tax=Strigamia maritima TaxID=126957 RepID=T1J040_STRMM